MISVNFGSYAMQDIANGRVVFDMPGYYDSPKNVIQADSLAEDDGALVVKQQYASKSWTVLGRIRSDTVANLESAWNDFKVAMAVKNQAFDVDYAGTTRRYLANAVNVVATKRDPTRIVYSVEFMSPDGVGWDLASSSLIDATTVTVPASQVNLTTGGTYKIEPAIVLTINSFTGSATNTITLTNDTTQRGLTLTYAVTAGDVIQIDSLNQTVYVNSIATTFSGQFPTFLPSENTLNYSDDFSARNVTISASYTKRWL